MVWILLRFMSSTYAPFDDLCLKKLQAIILFSEILSYLLPSEILVDVHESIQREFCLFCFPTQQSIFNLWEQVFWNITIVIPIDISLILYTVSRKKLLNISYHFNF